MSAVNQDPAERRLQPLERLAAQRTRENELGRSERSDRIKSAAFGFLIGGLLGLFVGHVGLLILEAHEEYLLTYYWTRELITFDDQRPLIPAYFLGGGLAGALVSYQFLVLRHPFPSFRGWALGSVAFAVGAVFLVGYFASLVIANFLDPITGPILGDQGSRIYLRFVFSLIVAIPTSFSIMGGAFYISFISAGIFLMLWTGTKVALERTAHVPPLAGNLPFAAVTYFSVAALAVIPYLLSLVAPASMLGTLVSLLSSLETLQP